MKVTFLKRGKALYPADPGAEKFMASTKDEQFVIVEARRARNADHHRKFFAMLAIVLDNQNFYKTTDDLLDVCKLAVGHVRTVETRSGTVRIPKSIAFESMDQDAFNEFYNRAVDWVIAEVIPGLERENLEAEVRNSLMEFAA